MINKKISGVKSPTFVASNRKLLGICKALSKLFGLSSNYAYIQEEKDQYGTHLVLHGQVNPDVVLIDEGKSTNLRLNDNYDLVKCAGGKNIYIRSPHNKLQDSRNLANI